MLLGTKLLIVHDKKHATGVGFPLRCVASEIFKASCMCCRTRPLRGRSWRGWLQRQSTGPPQMRHDAHMQTSSRQLPGSCSRPLLMPPKRSTSSGELTLINLTLQADRTTCLFPDLICNLLCYPYVYKQTIMHARAGVRNMSGVRP